MIPSLIKRRDIANYLALTMETVARVMSHLRELGMISFPQNPQTLVLDKTRLRELVFEHERSRAKKSSINVFRWFAAASCPVWVLAA